MSERILKILIFITFSILLFNRVLIWGFDNSIVGYQIERIVFWSFIISSLLHYKNSNHKIIIITSIVFVITSNFFKSFHTYLIITNYEKRINNQLYLRESTTIETFPVFHIMERNLFIERDITQWNSNLIYSENFQQLKKIKNIELIKKDSSLIILKYENENDIKIDTFLIKKL